MGRVRTSAAALRLPRRFDTKRSAGPDVVSEYSLPLMHVTSYKPVTYDWLFLFLGVGFRTFYKLSPSTCCPLGICPF